MQKLDGAKGLRLQETAQNQPRKTVLGLQDALRLSIQCSPPPHSFSWVGAQASLRLLATPTCETKLSWYSKKQPLNAKSAYNDVP